MEAIVASIGRRVSTPSATPWPKQIWAEISGFKASMRLRFETQLTLIRPAPNRPTDF